MLGKLFGKKPKTESPLNFTIMKNDEGEDVIAFTYTELFREFLRNSESSLDLTNLSDEELAHTFLYQHCLNWLSEHGKTPFFQEVHTFADATGIRYDRNWNPAFIKAIAKLNFEVMPQSEPELVEMYMNYVYGTRMMEEMEAMAEANPVSIAHPALTDPNNKFKG
jgi:hypothetical protein